MRLKRPKISLTTGQKLLLNLLLIAFAVAILWVRAGSPFFSIQRAMHHKERRQLLAESTLIFRYEDERYGYTLAAGRTDRHFHLTRMSDESLFWSRTDNFTVHSFALEKGVPIMLLSDNYAPPDGEAERSWFTAAAYCPGAVSGKATLYAAPGENSTEAEIVSEEFLCENGVFLFFLPRPEQFISGTGEYEILYQTMYPARRIGTVPVTLTVELYDENGALFAQASQLYPIL